jgi:DNA-binding NarL/FixJ family response regulator
LFDRGVDGGECRWARIVAYEFGSRSVGADRQLPDGLAEREAEVLTLIAQGRSNSEIAADLFVAEATVKTHINRIFAKTQSRDRAQATAYAHRNGLA